MGIGKNINISLLSGKNIPKATKTPIIAPDAPTIVAKNEVYKAARGRQPPKYYPNLYYPIYLPFNKFKTD